VLVVVRSKAWISCRLTSEIADSNPTGGMDVCLLWVSCVVRKKSLQRADQPYIGVLPTVMRRWVWSRNVRNEEALTIVGPQRHREEILEIFIMQSHYRPRQAQRLQGGLRSQISWQLVHEGSKVVGPTYRPPLPRRKYSCYLFLLEAESTPET